VFQVIPRKVFQPRVVFDLVGSVVAKSVLRFSLDHFVDEVGSLDRPVSGNFTFFNLNLLLQNVVSDLFPRLSDVGSSAKHAFVGHDSDSKVIYAGGVVDSTHYFWCHVAWGSRSILRIFRSPDSCNSEVSYSQVSILVDNQVFWFDVSVDDLFLVTDLETSNEAGTKEF